MTDYKYDRWPVLFSVYPLIDNNNPSVSVTDSALTITSDSESHTISNYVGMTSSAIASEFNANLSDHKVIKALDIGAEQIVTRSIVTDSVAQARPGSPLTFRYSGFITRNRERSVIQLKPPRSQSRFESWYARIGRGKIRTKFQDINFQAYPGINPDATYEFDVPEFIKQEWSLNYGAPYKDAVGEVPFIVRYHPGISATVLRVARRPIYWNKRNISILINDIRQPNSIIKYVDENNGLIYVSQKLGKNTRVSVDYTFHEEDYVYDAVDLNATLAHNPLIVDTYVAFYLKPTSSDSALVSGGDAVFHEIVNAEAAARIKTARIIPSTVGSAQPLYEPVIYLGSINVRQGIQYDEFEIIDTRTRGGGIYPDKVSTTPGTWREAEFFYDIGSFDGPEIPGNACVVIGVPTSITNSAMQLPEIGERVARDVAFGVVPLVEPIEHVPEFTSSLSFTDGRLTVELSSTSTSAISMSSMSNINGYNRDFFEYDMFEVSIEDLGRSVILPHDKVYITGAAEGFSRDYLSSFGPSDFSYSQVRNYGDSLEIIYSGLNHAGVHYQDVTTRLSGHITGATCFWDIYVDPNQDSVATPEWDLRAIEFPRFIPDKSSSTTNTYILPYYGGSAILVPHITHTGIFQMLNPGLAGQYFAEYDVNTPSVGMLSWQTMDTGMIPKLFTVEPPDGDGIGKWRHAYMVEYPDPNLTTNIPYSTKMTLMSGTWYDAATGYGEWSRSTWLSDKANLKDTGHPSFIYPTWLDTIKFNPRYDSASDSTFIPKIGGVDTFTGWTNISEDIERLKAFTDPNGYWAIQMNGWHSNEFDSDWPDYGQVQPWFTGLIEYVNTGTLNADLYPYMNMFYGITGDYYQAHSGEFVEDSNNDLRSTILGRSSKSSTANSYQIEHVTTGVFEPWVGLYTGYNLGGFYMDFWAGIAALTPDWNANIPEADRGSIRKISAAAVDASRSFATLMKDRTGQSEYPYISSEALDERFLGSIPTMYNGQGVGPSENTHLAPYFSATAGVPFMNTAHGDYVLMSDISPVLGSAVANTGGMNYCMLNQNWAMHYGKIPSALIVWTGDGPAVDPMTIYPTTGDSPFLAMWDFNKALIDQHDQLSQYCYMGRRLRPHDDFSEIVNVYNSSYGNSGAISLWNSITGDYVGMVVSSSDTGASGYNVPISLDVTRYPELADATGLVEITDGADTWIQSYTHTGNFTYTAPFPIPGVRIFEFR